MQYWKLKACLRSHGDSIGALTQVFQLETKNKKPLSGYVDYYFSYFFTDATKYHDQGNL